MLSPTAAVLLLIKTDRARSSKTLNLFDKWRKIKQNKEMRRSKRPVACVVI